MFLTGEGALLAVTLTALVCGMVGAWALLRVGVRRPGGGPRERDVSETGTMRRVIVPAGTARKM